MSSSDSHNSDSEMPETAPEMDAERRDRLRNRLLERAGAAMQVTRETEAEWRSFLPGIRVKILYSDSSLGIQTALWRLEPGAHIPAHPHSEDEECYVLDGVLELRGERYHQGDFMLAPAGSRHSTIRSPQGALMLIRGERVSWRERLFLRAAVALGR